MPEQNSEPSRPLDPPLPPTTPPTAPPAPPEAPPAPPAPSAADRPPVPQYGEYAPAGYLPPGDASAPSASNPYGVPGYGAQAAAPGYAPADAAPRKKRRTWDVVLSSILLVLALFGMAAGLIYAAIFSNPELFNQAMESQGYSGFSASVGSAPAVLAISHIVLFLLALGLTIPLLIRGRIVVFWIPLAIGVVAAVVFWVTVFSVITSDPGFLARYGA